MLYELRTYDCCPGRLRDLLTLVEDHATKFWDLHGIRQGGFWTTVIGPHNHRLYYFLLWENLAERDQKVLAFQTDPEWIKVRAEHEANGPIIANVASEILTPTTFSGWA